MIPAAILGFTLGAALAWWTVLRSSPSQGGHLLWRMWWRFGFGPILWLLRFVPVAEWRREHWSWRLDIWAMDHIGKIGRKQPEALALRDLWQAILAWNVNREEFPGDRLDKALRQAHVLFTAAGLDALSHGASELEADPLDEIQTTDPYVYSLMLDCE